MSNCPAVTSKGPGHKGRAGGGPTEGVEEGQGEKSVALCPKVH